MSTNVSIVWLTLWLEELNSTGNDSRVVFEDIHNVVFGDAVRGIKKVQNLRRRRDSVFGGGLRISEPVVSVAHKVFEWRRVVYQIERLLDVVEEGLLGVTQLHFVVKKRHVIHLDHSTALFALQELDPNHIPEETEQIEHSVAIHLFVV